MPELRKRFLVDEWVAISPERASRPRQLHLHSPPDEGSPCPFCPENQEVTPASLASYDSPSYPTSSWGVRVVPNKFPALRVEESLGSSPESGLFRALGGVGAHEVIIESPAHLHSLADLPREHLPVVLKAWQDRSRDLRCDKRLKQVIIFRNQGAFAGATLGHVHSQLIALPIVAPAIRRELIGARRYYDEYKRCPFCVLVEEELARDQRILFQDEKTVVLLPFGSRVPFETWLFPRSHGAHFVDATDEQLHSLAGALFDVLQLWKRALGDLSFNLALHSLPFDFEDETYYHWHLEMIPRTSQIAGFEWGAQMYINPTASEVAARHLKSLLK